MRFEAVRKRFQQGLRGRIQNFVTAIESAFCTQASDQVGSDLVDEVPPRAVGDEAPVQRKGGAGHEAIVGSGAMAERLTSVEVTPG